MLAVVQQLAEREQVRVEDPLQRTKLSFEAQQGARRDPQQQLERAGRTLLAIVSLEDHAHPAATQRTDDLKPLRAREADLHAGASIRPKIRGSPAGRSSR